MEYVHTFNIEIATQLQTNDKVCIVMIKTQQISVEPNNKSRRPQQTDSTCADMLRNSLAVNKRLEGTNGVSVVFSHLFQIQHPSKNYMSCVVR